MIGLLLFAFMIPFNIVTDGLNDMEAGCEGHNTTTMGCELIDESSPLRFVLTNPVLVFIIMMIPIWMFFGPLIRKMWRSITYEIGDLFETSYTESDRDDEEEKEKYLKETKTKLKEELIRKKSSNNIDAKPEENKGVQWGSGIEMGGGMDDYENKLKGGDEKKDG